MAEYGLTLPDNDLTANEFKELARRLGRAAFVPLFLRYYERLVTTEATIEEQRKGLADIGRWTGVEEDRKIDPNANLPVFNIIFGAPGSGHTIEAMDVTPAAPEPAPEELPVFGSLADNAAFRELAHKVMTPPMEAPDAKLQAGAPADAARADLAETLRALDAADAQDQPAGQLAPAAQGLQLPAKQSRRRRRGSATVSEALPALVPALGQAPVQAVQQAGEGLARSHDTLLDALNTLDSALDGF